jgi:hypothetical protein
VGKKGEEERVEGGKRVGGNGGRKRTNIDRENIEPSISLYLPNL